MIRTKFRLMDIKQILRINIDPMIMIDYVYFLFLIFGILTLNSSIMMNLVNVSHEKLIEFISKDAGEVGTKILEKFG